MTSSNETRSSRSAASARPDGPRHAHTLRTHRVLRALTLSLVAIVTFTGVGFTVAGARLQGNVNAAPIDALLKNRPTKVADPDDPKAGQDLNILVLGSDYRGSGDDVDDGVEGMRADTTIVLHISADRSRVDLVSIPRDSIVAIPSCTVTGGGTTTPQTTKFNSAFALGWNHGRDIASAAACAVTTVESLTGVFIDSYAVVDFGGFRKMVNALGGVSMCIPNDIDAPKAGNLKLTAGYQQLDGKTALKYARARTGKGLGDGSDLNRIGRQQELMSAIVSEVFNQNLLTDLPALYSFLDAATSSLTTDPGLSSIKNLSGLAFSMRGVRSDSISFMTVPWGTAPTDKNAVVWTPAAAEIWDNMANDRPLITPEPTSDPTPTATPPKVKPGTGTEPTGTDAPTTTPSDSPEPTPTVTKKAGRDTFTAADVTADCGVQ